MLLFCGILCLTDKQEVDFLFPEDANQVRFETGHLDINCTNNRRKLMWNRAQSSFKWLNMLTIFGTPLLAKCIHILENCFENKVKACFVFMEAESLVSPSIMPNAIGVISRAEHKVPVKIFGAIVVHDLDCS